MQNFAADMEEVLVELERTGRDWKRSNSAQREYSPLRRSRGSSSSRDAVPPSISLGHLLAVPELRSSSDADSIAALDQSAPKKEERGSSSEEKAPEGKSRRKNELRDFVQYCLKNNIPFEAREEVSRSGEDLDCTVRLSAFDGVSSVDGKVGLGGTRCSLEKRAMDERRVYGTLPLFTALLDSLAE